MNLTFLLLYSVAIRTMTIRSGQAIFNVGGGITIDSDPEAEYEESLIKAEALLGALGCSRRSNQLVQKVGNIL